MIGGALIIVSIAFLANWWLNSMLETNDRPATKYDVTRLALTIAAGFGGLVALVVAYRRQQDLEEGRFIERFGAAAMQLGHTDVAVRIAGVYAMAGVADKSRGEQRQQCIDVLCGYLRLPYLPETGTNHQTHLVQRRPSREPGEENESHFQYRQNDREVRQTIVRVIAAHLTHKGKYTWSDYDFDFTGAHLEEANFTGATFNGETTLFTEATFSGNTKFIGASFSGEVASFDEATFSGNIWFDGVTCSVGLMSFKKTELEGQTTSFAAARIGGFVDFEGAAFNGHEVVFSKAKFHGSITSFKEATFNNTKTSFDDATFSSRHTKFTDVVFNLDVTFRRAVFEGDATWLNSIEFTEGHVSFSHAMFTGENTWFNASTFTGPSAWFGEVAFNCKNLYFDGAIFQAGVTSFTGATFRSNLSSFRETTFVGDSSFQFANFDSGVITFDQPLRWEPAPLFDWSNENKTEEKPANVKPDDWPPVPTGFQRF